MKVRLDPIQSLVVGQLQTSETIVLLLVTRVIETRDRLASTGRLSRNTLSFHFQYHKAYLPLAMSHPYISSIPNQKTADRHAPFISCPLQPQHKSAPYMTSSAIP